MAFLFGVEGEMSKNIKTLFILHLLMMVYSLSGIFSKKAAASTFLSFEFCIWYFLIFLLLGLYAVVWQQILKRIPLTKAYANRAIAVVWGIIWGLIFFKESVTTGKIAGAVLIIAGIVLFAYSGSGDKEKYEQ